MAGDKNYLKAKRNWLFEERATFAWIPTLTSVCRQALFSGRLPFYFQDSINTTAKEEKQWQNFWDERRRVLYLKGLGSSWDADLEQLDPEAEVLGPGGQDCGRDHARYEAWNPGHAPADSALA